MPPLTPRFNPDVLTTAHGLAAWRAACFDPATPDSVFHQGPSRHLDTRARGRNEAACWFGPARHDQGSAIYELAGVRSVSLAGAVLDPISMAIFSPRSGFFSPPVDALRDRLRVSQALNDAIVTPVAGGDIHDFRHFLYNGLPAALMVHGMLGPRVRVVGPVLHPWQAELLAAVGLDRYYDTLTEPTQFSRIIATDMTWPNSPSRFARGVIDRLRFRFGQDHPRTRRLLIGAEHDFTGDDRLGIEGPAQDFGFEVVDVAPMSIAARARLFASATSVICASRAALDLVGFCDPGTAILELRAAGVTGNWTRVTSALFGLEWYCLTKNASGSIAATGVDHDLLRACLKAMVGAA